jgi:hypothetical protein
MKYYEVTLYSTQHTDTDTELNCSALLSTDDDDDG